MKSDTGCHHFPSWLEELAVGSCGFLFTLCLLQEAACWVLPQDLPSWLQFPKWHREVAKFHGCLLGSWTGGCAGPRQSPVQQPKLSCLLGPAACLPSWAAVHKVMQLPLHLPPACGTSAKWRGQVARPGRQPPLWGALQAPGVSSVQQGGQLG